MAVADAANALPPTIVQWPNAAAASLDDVLTLPTASAGVEKSSFPRTWHGPISLFGTRCCCVAATEVAMLAAGNVLGQWKSPDKRRHAAAWWSSDSEHDDVARHREQAAEVVRACGFDVPAAQ